MKAVMLVGGLGTRLRPLTLSVKKELMPVAGRPFLEHVLAHLAKHDIEEAILTTGHLAEAFEDFPEEQSHGVNLTLVKEDEALDTCGAVKNVEAMLDGPFLVCNGDILTDLDVSALVAFHRERASKATIALTPVDDPSAYGLVPTDDDGRIERFIEKPRPDEVDTNLINAGTYVMERDVLERVPAGEPYSFERALFPALVAAGEMFGFRSDDYWLDIGTPEKYAKANRDVLAGLVGLVPPGSRDERGVWLGERCEVNPTSKLRGPAYIGPGSRIEPAVSVSAGASIGSRSRLAGHSSVDASVLHDEVLVGPGATVTRSVIGEGAVIGEGTRVVDSVIGTGVRIGGHNELRDGIRIWPGLEIPDATVTFRPRT